VAVYLALGLAQQGYQVGLLDVDLPPHDAGVLRRWL
jgi:Mrp family chromosome partitioning ATPase